MDASSSYIAPNMASYIDVEYIDPSWANLNYQDPMMTCIDPNYICPTEILVHDEQTPYYQQQQTSSETFGTNITNIVNQQQQNIQYQTKQQEYHNQQHIMVSNYVYGHEVTTLPGTSTGIPLYASNNVVQSYSYRTNDVETKVIPDLTVQTNQFRQQQGRIQQDQNFKQQKISTENYEHQYQYQNLIEPPPTLARHEETKYGVQESLRLHKELTKQRQERIKARLERQPAQLPSDSLRKNSGKKLTGRERQLELERQETEQIKLRDNYMRMIKQLEAKCNKLREILENIVTTSPDYNNQMMIYLETERLMRLDEQD